MFYVDETDLSLQASSHEALLPIKAADC